VADFFTRTKELEEMVGKGTLKGEFGANRIYAVNQHEKNWQNFMGRYGYKEIRNQNQGGPKFVENAWKEMWMDWYEDFADAALKGTLNQVMERAMRDFDNYLKERAPVRDNKLRQSGEYTVYDGGRVVAKKESQVPYEG
jgi:hypothetical protein